MTVKVRRGGTDTWGNDRPTTEHDVEGCVKWPRTSSETADYSQTVATGYMLSVPVGADLLPTDEVLLPGEPEDGPWWQVEGDPLPWDGSPFTNRKPGTIVALTRSTG